MKFVFVLLLIRMAHGHQTPVYSQPITDLVADYQCKFLYDSFTHGLWYWECVTSIEGHRECRSVLLGQSATCPSRVMLQKAAPLSVTKKIGIFFCVCACIIIHAFIVSDHKQVADFHRTRRVKWLQSRYNRGLPP